jgi:hypothetical protein
MRQILPRDRVFTRTLHDLGDPIAGRPRDIQLTYSQHHCTKCRRYFTADMSDLAAPKARYTQRVAALAVRLVVEDGMHYQTASWYLWRDHRVFVPFATIQNGVEARGKKGGRSNLSSTFAVLISPLFSRGLLGSVLRGAETQTPCFPGFSKDVPKKRQKSSSVVPRLASMTKG